VSLESDLRGVGMVVRGDKSVWYGKKGVRAGETEVVSDTLSIKREVGMKVLGVPMGVDDWVSAAIERKLRKAASLCKFKPNSLDFHWSCSSYLGNLTLDLQYR